MKGLKTKIKTAILVAIVGISAIAAPLFAFVSVNGEVAHTVKAATLPTVGFVNTTVTMDANKVAALKVEVKGEVEGTVTVTYHSESRSAVEGVDFNSAYGSVTLTQEEPVATIALTGYTTDTFAVTYSGISYKKFFTV
ncbi:MAG: hypothetical protein MJ072_00470, partial [Clostridia bacterium]|nr:hypothetical protein [Clostridia bacterium]